jgi:hypothetical protein
MMTLRPPRGAGEAFDEVGFGLFMDIPYKVEVTGSLRRVDATI